MQELSELGVLLGQRRHLQQRSIRTASYEISTGAGIRPRKGDGALTDDSSFSTAVSALAFDAATNNALA